ncbi:DUF1430 domain-containing protein [Amedibacillus sp. YH-ame10]
MKKLLYIITIILSMLIFYNNFSSESYINKANIQMINYKIGTVITTKPYILGLPQNVDSPQNREEFITTMIEFARENNLTLVTSKIFTEEFVTNTETYIFSKDKDILKKLSMISNEKIDFSKDTNKYISTDRYDTKAYNYYDYIDKMFNNTRKKEVVRIYQMEQYIQKFSNEESLGIGILCENPESVKELIANSPLSQYVPNIDALPPASEVMPFETDNNQSVLYALILIIFVLFMLLIFCYISRSRKEIGIRYLMGSKTSKITRKMFMNTLMFCIILYAIIQIVLFYFFCGSVRLINENLVRILFYYYIIFILANVLSYIIARIMIQRYTISTILKSKKSNQIIVDVNLILKAIMTCFIIGPFLSMIPSVLSDSYDYIEFIQRKSEIEKYAFMTSLDYGEHAIANQRTLYELGTKHGAIYEDFATYQLQNEMEIKTTDKPIYPFITVNKNYLKEYELYDTDGKGISINDYGKKYTYFIPETCSYDKADIFGLNDYGGVVVKIKDPKTMYPHNASGFLTSLKNPIIVLMPDDFDSFDTIGSWDNYVPLGESMTLFQNELKKTDMNGRVFFSDNAIPLATTLSDYQYQILQGALLVTVYLSTYIAFTYLTLSLYFEENKKQLSLRYLYGRSFFQRYGKFLLLNASIYLVPVMLSFVWLHLNLLHVIAYVLFFGVVELGIALYRIYKFQKNGIVNVLKGE